MPNINLSKLNGQELRRLLDATRRRGDAALSYQVLQEMATRREQAGDRPGLGLLKRRSREPHIIDVDLADDPIEAKDEIPPMPNWRAPQAEPEPEAEPVVAARAEPAPEPVAAPAPRRLRPAKVKPVADLAAAVAAVDADAAPAPKPRSVWDADPEPTPKPRGVWDAEREPAAVEDAFDGGLLLHPRVVRPTGAAAPRRFPIGLAAGLLVGVAMGMGAGWSARAMLRETPVMAAAPPARLQTAALQIVPAAVTPPPVVTPEPAPTPAAEAEPASELLPSDAAESAPALSDSTEVADNDAVDPAPQPERRRPEVVRTAEERPGKACAAELTPADREICADPELGRLQRELRDAYAEALDAHQDRDVLRQRQLAWRAARNGISDPQRLARLYEERIRKLNAATAEARQQR